MALCYVPSILPVWCTAVGPLGRIFFLLLRRSGLTSSYVFFFSFFLSERICRNERRKVPVRLGPARWLRSQQGN